MTARRLRRPEPGPESGYAMLMVFLIAAMIAIALYKEMPRVAFEAQRTKEQLLIERGEQYKRAIQLFVRKMSRYPATIEELENTNNIRFLRKRYVDPMTGKDKWRLIHINGGVLTDSIVPKNKPGQGQPGQDGTPPVNTNTFIGEGPVMGATNDPNQQQINPALRRRPSDDRPVVAAEAPDEPAQDADQDSSSDNDNNDNNNDEATPAPGQPGAQANATGMPNQQMPGMPAGRIPRPGAFQPGMNPGQPGYNPNAPNQIMPFGTAGGPGSSNPGITGGFPNSTNNGQSTDSSSSSGVYVAPGLGSAPAATNTGTQMGAGYPNQQGMGGMPGQPGAYPGQSPGFPGRPGMFPGQQGAFPGQQMPGAFNNQSAFNNSNTAGAQQNTPSAFNNNFGLNGPSNIQQPGQSLPGMGGTQMGGGIAGVATEFSGPSIKIYNERKKYNEWEFVYDQTKDRGLAGVQRGGGAPGTPAQQMGTMPGQAPGQPGTGFGQQGGAFGQQGSAFGGQQGSAFGGQSGGAFGSPSSGFGQPPPQQQPQPQQP